MKNSSSSEPAQTKTGWSRLTSSCYLLILISALCVPRSAFAITPWYLKLVNATNVSGAQLMGAQLLTPPDQLNTPFTVNGTNLVFGGNSVSNFTFSLDSSGYTSNALYAGTYKFVLTNYNAAFIAVIPDTTNVQSLTLYITNVQVFSGVALTSYGNITNLLGFPPMTNNAAGVTNALGFIPANAANTNDFARATPAGVTNALGFIPANAANTNDFARATPAGISNSLAYIPANAANTNDFARATPAGISNSLAYIPANAANTNDFARATLAGITAAQGYTSKTNDGFIGLTNTTFGVASITTNGFIAWVSYKTNGNPGNAFTNLPMGSICSTTNGQNYVLSNLVWNLK